MGTRCQQCNADLSDHRYRSGTWVHDADACIDRLKRNWGMLRNHVTAIADGGARSAERQGVFVEIRDIMSRIESE